MFSGTFIKEHLYTWLVWIFIFRTQPPNQLPVLIMLIRTLKIFYLDETLFRGTEETRVEGWNGTLRTRRHYWRKDDSSQQKVRILVTTGRRDVDGVFIVRDRTLKDRWRWQLFTSSPSSCDQGRLDTGSRSTWVWPLTLKTEDPPGTRERGGWWGVLHPGLVVPYPPGEYGAIPESTNHHNLLGCLYSFNCFIGLANGFTSLVVFLGYLIFLSFLLSFFFSELLLSYLCPSVKD